MRKRSGTANHVKVIRRLVSFAMFGFASLVFAGTAYAYAPTYTPYSTTSSYIGGVAQGPDGNIWYTSRSGGAVGKLLPSGSVIEYDPPSGNDTTGIAAGPDGNMWFTIYDANKIGKITTSGVITEYTIPTPSSVPYRIAAGADGNMWFIEGDGNKIGKITPSGVITEYNIPTPNSNPQGIALGPDGNMWFTQSSGNKIGKITPAGVVTEYSMGSESPMDIVAGPDGNMWFSSYDSHVGKISTSGSYTVYNTSAMTAGIAVGPDNLIWFTLVSGVNRIGSVNASGVVEEHSLSGNPYSLSMTAGGDGNLYAAGYEPSGRILKLNFPSKPVLQATKSATVTAGSSVHIDVLSGVSGNPDPATLAIVTPPTHGTAVVNSITYTPTAGYVGSDSFTYKVCSADYNLICAQGTVNVTVLAAAPNAGFGDSPTSDRSGWPLLSLGSVLMATGYAIRQQRRHPGA